MDPTTHRIYLPAAEFETGVNGRRAPKPGTFVILVVAPQAVKQRPVTYTIKGEAVH